MTIGEKIKIYRNIAKLTQEQLAKKTNLSRSYIADIERDRYNPSFETLKNIAKALNVPLSKLSDDEEDFDTTEDELTPEFFAIQRNSKKLTQQEQQRLLKIMKATFDKLENSTEEDDADDYI